MRRLVVVLGQGGTSQAELLARVAALPADVATTLVSSVAVDGELASACEGVVLLSGARIRGHAGAGTSSAAGTSDSGTVIGAQGPSVAQGSARGSGRRSLSPERLARAGVRVVRGLFLRAGGPTARAILRQMSGLRLRREALGSRDLRALAQGCEVLCAADGLSVMAVWSLARRFPGPRAVLGIAAADYELRRGGLDR